MYRNNYDGGDGWTYYPMRIRIGSKCPVCNGLRGKPYEYRFCDDGEWFTVDKWDNPCGHLDKYGDVYKESKKITEMIYNEFKPLNFPDGVKSVLTAERYQGTPVIVYTNGIEQHVYNMEGERLALLSSFKGIDFLKLSSSGKWFAYAGVYLKTRNLGKIVLNEAVKFVITDVLVYDGECVINMPGEIRVQTYLSKMQYHPAAGKAEIYNFVSGTPISGVFINA